MKTQQLKKDELVFWGMSGMSTAGEKAAEVAASLHGLSGWQGVKADGLYAPAGLRNLMNRWLRKHTTGTAMVEERYLCDGKSAYYPYWK